MTYKYNHQHIKQNWIRPAISVVEGGSIYMRTTCTYHFTCQLKVNWMIFIWHVFITTLIFLIWIVSQSDPHNPCPNHEHALTGSLPSCPNNYNYWRFSWVHVFRWCTTMKTRSMRLFSPEGCPHNHTIVGLAVALKQVLILERSYGVTIWVAGIVKSI